MTEIQSVKYVMGEYYKDMGNFLYATPILFTLYMKNYSACRELNMVLMALGHKYLKL